MGAKADARKRIAFYQFSTGLPSPRAGTIAANFSAAETRAVDAFAMSLIKAERQVRKLFTHLV
jgi:hypothetical protein